MQKFQKTCQTVAGISQKLTVMIIILNFEPLQWVSSYKERSYKKH